MAVLSHRTKRAGAVAVALRHSCASLDHRAPPVHPPQYRRCGPAVGCALASVILCCAPPALASDPALQRYETGKALLAQGRYEEAAGVFQEAAGAPDGPRLARAPASASGPSQAVPVMRDQLADYHVRAAEKAAADGEHLAAIRHAERAAELGADARTLRRITKGARRALRQLERLEAKRAAWREQADAAEARGDTRGAVKWWTRLAKQVPDDPEARQALDRLRAAWQRDHPRMGRAEDLRQPDLDAGREEYQVAIGDILEVFVWQQPDLSRDVVIRPDGRMSFPLVGDVEALGQTLTDLDRELTERLKAYVKYPDVSLALKRFGGTKTIVLGEVGRPGIYVPTGAGRALDVIAMAGGFGPDANSNNVILVRGGLHDPQLARLNLHNALTGGQFAENVLLQPNDILYIAPEGKGLLASMRDIMNDIDPLLANVLVGQAVGTNFGMREFQRTGRSTGVE